MSRAEERANQTFPEEKGLIHGISGMRYAYIRGYHQAEKDLALTIEDVEQIIHIVDDVYKSGFDMYTEEFYSEVFRRFNEKKEE